jgi:hypothetical protein
VIQEKTYRRSPMVFMPWERDADQGTTHLLGRIHVCAQFFPGKDEWIGQGIDKRSQCKRMRVLRPQAAQVNSHEVRRPILSSSLFWKQSVTTEVAAVVPSEIEVQVWSSLAWSRWIAASATYGDLTVGEQA